ncbi:MAG: hypothetical protein AAF318_07720 [Pseudomonadota bacterium]
MPVFGRTFVVAAIFTGSVAAAAIAANNDRFYGDVTSAMSALAGNFVLAGDLITGDAHLDDPTVVETGDKQFNDRIASSSVVTHVEVIGGGPKQRIVLLNPEGQEVFSHDPELNTTTVAKDAVIPSVTVRESDTAIAELRLVTAAPVVETPTELRDALVAGVTNTPELFYREDL